MDLVMVKPRFTLGRLVATRAVFERMTPDGNFADFVRMSLNRHAWGDWGDLSDGDKRENEIAADQGDRILSAYNGPDGSRIWIITEGGRNATTTLLYPEEY